MKERFACALHTMVLPVVQLTSSVSDETNASDAIYFTTCHVHRRAPESGSIGGVPKSKLLGKTLRR